MLHNDVFSQKLASFEFLLARKTLPYIFLLILINFFSLIDKSLDLLLQYAVVVFNLANFLNPFFCFLLYLLKNILSVLQLLVICLHPKKCAADPRRKSSLILVLSAGIIVISMDLSKIKKENV